MTDLDRMIHRARKGDTALQEHLCRLAGMAPFWGAAAKWEERVRVFEMSVSLPYGSGPVITKQTGYTEARIRLCVSYVRTCILKLMREGSRGFWVPLEVSNQLLLPRGAALLFSEMASPRMQQRAVQAVTTRAAARRDQIELLENQLAQEEKKVQAAQRRVHATELELAAVRLSTP